MSQLVKIANMSPARARRVFRRYAGSIPKSDKEMKSKYRAAAKKHHPDHDGSHERMSDLSRAYKILRGEEKADRYSKGEIAYSSARGLGGIAGGLDATGKTIKSIADISTSKSKNTKNREKKRLRNMAIGGALGAGADYISGKAIGMDNKGIAGALMGASIGGSDRFLKNRKK